MTKSNVLVSDQKLPNFQPKMEAAACYLEIDCQLLLLQQGVGRPEEGSWGVPAGKLEPKETPEMAAQRELFEETSIQIIAPSQMRYLGSLYIREPERDYVYYMFKIQLDQKPLIQLSSEHKNYQWAHAKDLGNIPLRTGLNRALQYYRKGSQRQILEGRKT